MGSGGSAGVGRPQGPPGRSRSPGGGPGRTTSAGNAPGRGRARAARGDRSRGRCRRPPHHLDHVLRARGDDPSVGHLLDGQHISRFLHLRGLWVEYFCSAVSDSGAQKRVFSRARSESGSQDTLISIIRSIGSPTRPALARPSATAGMSSSAYNSRPLPEVQMKPSPTRPAYRATIGPPAATKTGTGSSRPIRRSARPRSGSSPPRRSRLLGPQPA